ncbi:MAG TPA: 23S rRNA (pseudouridine(1915)-N(3))-methyltransferase RlmH [Gemmatimonadaceae bacterium]|nr:23S rRNA (pseudouridine(1915)-N(3))-methyltransferase RlmH [Gemmatimonadaceae bacterium]
MKVIVAAVGKPRHPALAAAIREFEQRAERYWPLEVHEVRGEPAKAVSADLVRVREGERLAKVLPRSAHVVACDPGGSSMTSEEFSGWLQKERERGRDVAFVIGGAFGLSDAVRRSARERLALAPWTLSHELARLVLAEQLYRAGTIVRREPYHK